MLLWGCLHSLQGSGSALPQRLVTHTSMRCWLKSRGFWFIGVPLALPGQEASFFSASTLVFLGFLGGGGVVMS